MAVGNNLSENFRDQNSEKSFILAPIPISKVRAFAPELLHMHEHEGHGNLSKVRAYEANSKASSSHNENHVGVDSDTPLQVDHGKDKRTGGSKASSAHSQSLSSALDYRRTTQWLREILKYPETYSSKLTELPEKKRAEKKPLVTQRQTSESLHSSSLSSRRLTTQSRKCESKFDGHIFKRAVSDLERLLNEALALATQVVDSPETTPHERYKEPSIGLHSHCHSFPSGNDDSYASDRSLVPSSSPDNTEDAKLVVQSRRPTYKHAATSSGHPNRPRLSDIVQNYSNNEGGQPARNSPALMHSQDESDQHAPHVSFHIPRRQSSQKNIKRKPEKSHASLVKEIASKAAEGPGHYVQPKKSNKSKLSSQTRKRNTSISRGIGAEDSSNAAEKNLPERDIAGRQMHTEHGISLRRRSHVSLRGAQAFNLAKSHKRQPIARDWSTARKRFVASVACISTALIGIILGIYAGLVPSIQYYIVDESHSTVHGNTGCFLGLAVPTFFLWPLPLLHGRKPYILSSLVIAMPLLFPQALAVNSQRLNDRVSWRALLLAARTLMGGSLGFASMNFHSILTDLFGASLMSTNPHQEVVDQFDARRHGGGMGVWLGIWTWCWIGSLSVGFLVGACIIDKYPPAWGFYISIMVIAAVIFLNVLCPEVRRSPYRRSIAEVRSGSDISRRVARGEIMMHRVKTGPKWWGEEVYHGVALSLEMLRQPGFAVLTVYSAWIYAQVVLVIVLLGSLTSKFYAYRSPVVGLLVGCVAFGAFLAIPFQKASFFSRSRQAQLNTNLATLDRKVSWSSHLVRRTIFTNLLPLAGICYAAVSSGPPMPIGVPTFFATCVGFLSCLAIAECNGLVMEAFDCSDLSPGMTGRQRGTSGKNQKRTNYSSFPRLTAGFATIHTLAFIFAAGATALGGQITRTLGQRVTTGVVAGILLLLTVLLLLVLIRFTEARIIPQCKSQEMDKLIAARRKSTIRRESMPNDPQAVMEEEKAWRPVMIGNPVGKRRRMNIFELSSLTRWQEIRRKNKLVDSGAHLNRDAWDQGMEALDDQMGDLRREAHDFFHNSGKNQGIRRLRRTDEESETDGDVVELDSMARNPGEAGPSASVGRGAVMNQPVAEENEDVHDGTRNPLGRH